MSLQPQSQVGAPPDTSNLEELQKRKSRLLANLSEGLPTLPGYVFELNGLLCAKVVDLRRVSRVIRTDPSLSAQVIRLTNSALLNLRRRVVSIEEAVVLLGTERLRTLALTCSLLEYLGQKLSAGQVQAYWQHSFLTALLSERIARGTEYPQPEQAYLAGLLHDIGSLPLLMDSCEKKEGASEEEEAPGESVEWEQEHFGVDHCEVGRMIGTSWNFPPALIEVFELHHRPQDATGDPHLVGMIACADRFCHLRGVVFGSVAPQLEIVEQEQYDEVLRDCLPDLSEEKRASLLEIIETEFLHLIQLLEFGSSGLFGGAGRRNTT